MLDSDWSEDANSFSITAARREGPTTRSMNCSLTRLFIIALVTSVISILTGRIQKKTSLSAVILDV